MPSRPTFAELFGDLSLLSDADLRLLAQSLGVNDSHVTRISQAVQHATRRLVGARNPSDLTIEQVRKAAASAYRRELTRTTRDLAQQYASREMGVTDDTEEYWISVVDDRRCEDCEARHGEKQTHAQWEADGLPRSGNTVCFSNCRCELVDASRFQERMLQNEDTRTGEVGDVQAEITLEAG